MDARQVVVPLFVILTLAGCSSPATRQGTTPPCVTSHTSIAAMQGEAGYNESWNATTLRDALAQANFTLKAPEFGVAGRDPFGLNFSLAEAGEPRERYLVDFPVTSGETSDEARLQEQIAPAFAASVTAFENATGWHHGAYFVRPIFVVADYIPC